MQRLAGVVLLSVVAVPSTADAQRDEFFDALLPFYWSLAGVYGDEGAQAAAHLEKLSATLSRWDRSLTASETQLHARLRDDEPGTALEVHSRLASLYAERSRFREALREINEDLRIDPDRIVFHRFKALLYHALNKPEETADALRSAWLLDRRDAQSAYQLVVHRSPRTTRAELEQALGTLAAAERDLMRGEFRALGSPFLSLNSTRDDVSTAMAFSPAGYARGFSLLLEGRFDEGLRALRAAMAADPLVADPISRNETMVRGIAALRQGLVEEAIGHMAAVRAVAPASSEANRLLGAAYVVAGNIEKSLEYLREAVRLNPRDERSWLAIARTLDALGDVEGCAAVLEAASRALPDSGVVRWSLAAMADKRRRTANTELDLIAGAERLVLLTGRGEFYGRLARFAQAHLKYDRAVELLEQRVAATPNNTHAHKDLGRAYIDRGDEERGYAELVMALMLDPGNAEAFMVLGRVHLAAGRYANAAAALEKAVALAPSDPSAIQALADALIRVGRTAEGQKRAAESEQLRRLVSDLQRRVRTAAMLVFQAEVSMREGRHDRAIEVWREVIALVGDSSTYYLRLAEAFAAAKRLDEAVDHYRKAIAMKAGPEAHRQLATVYSELGRTAESARERQAYTEGRLNDLRQRSGVTVNP
jgi:tetratricopeptide (TPR) repeat protein